MSVLTRKLDRFCLYTWCGVQYIRTYLIGHYHRCVKRYIVNLKQSRRQGWNLEPWERRADPGTMRGAMVCPLTVKRLWV